MQFMLAMVGEESGWENPPDDMEQVIEDMENYNRSLVEAGALVDGAGLQPPSTASTLTYTSEGATVTDGPFAETKEHLAGYWVIQVDSKDEALEWAKKVPIQDGKIEVREVMGYGTPIDLETFERTQEQAKKDLMEQVEGRQDA
jgi:hypothetical protein